MNPFETIIVILQTLTLIVIAVYTVYTHRLAKFSQAQVKLTEESLDLAKGKKQKPFKIGGVKTLGKNITVFITVDIAEARLTKVTKMSGSELEVKPNIGNVLNKNQNIEISIPKEMHKSQTDFVIIFFDGHILKKRRASLRLKGTSVSYMDIRDL